MIKGLHRIHNNLFKLEAAKILPLCKNGMSKSTLLDIFATSFKFAHYNDFIDRRYDLLDINSFSTLDISKLFEIEKEIINRLKEAREDHITQISFIQDEINKRLKSFLEHPSFNVYEILAVSHFIHGGRPLINSDWELNEFAVKSFIYDYAARLDETQEYSGCGKDSFFYNYKKFKSEEANHRSFTFNNKKTFIARGYHYATHINNLIKPITGDSILFNLAYELRNSEKTIDEVYQEISKVISYEKNYHLDNIKPYRNSDSFELKLNYPSLYIEKDKNNNLKELFNEKELRISEKKEETDPNLKSKAKKNATYIKRNQNILHTGCAGSGLTETQLGLLTQEIAVGEGLIYVYSKGDNSMYSKFLSIVQHFDRTEDFIYLSFKNVKKLLDEEFVKYVIQSKKILLINLPSLLDTSELVNETSTNIISSLLQYIQSFKEKVIDNETYYNTKTSIYFTDIEAYQLELLKDIETFFEEQSSEFFYWRFSTYSLDWCLNKDDKEKNDTIIRIIKNHIQNIFVLKTEDPTYILDNFDNPKSLDLRDLKNCYPGEFYIITNNIIDNLKHQGYYCWNDISYNELNYNRMIPPYYGKY